jgi:hypothetical protein
MWNLFLHHYIDKCMSVICEISIIINIAIADRIQLGIWSVVDVNRQFDCQSMCLTGDT